MRVRHTPKAATSSWRRSAAAWACALWIVGFELLPNLHIAAHHESEPHTHAGDESATQTRYTVSVGGSHSHGAVTHSHDGDDSRELGTDNPTTQRNAALFPASDEETIERPTPQPFGHGLHSLAHRGITALSTPPVLAPAPPRDYSQVEETSSLRWQPRSNRPRHERGRGPPA